MTSVEIPLSFTSPPLNLNQRMHWAQKAKITKAIRDEVATKARPLADQFTGQHIAIRLHWMPRDNRRRDPSNCIATQKPAIDGLVDAGIMPDDTPEYIAELMPKIHRREPGQPAACWLEIRESRDDD